MKVNNLEIRPFADLRGADLTGADLRGANLRGANLRGANLENINYNYNTIGIHPAPQGQLIGYKKCGSAIIKLKIPTKAKRSCATSRKHRCEYAKVIAIDGTTRKGYSYDHHAYGKVTTYKVGDLVYPNSYDDDRWNECSNGIHFFLTEEEARTY